MGGLELEETGWTAGPWRVVRYGDGDSLVICLDEAGNQRVAFMAVPGCRDHLERKAKWREIKANARLIAAAPELYEALAELIDHCWETEKALTEKGYRMDYCGGSLPLCNARAALSKANGHG